MLTHHPQPPDDIESDFSSDNALWWGQYVIYAALVAAAIVLALAFAVPAFAQYADDSGGGQPICNENVAGYWYGGQQCVHDPFGDNWTWM